MVLLFQVERMFKMRNLLAGILVILTVGGARAQDTVFYRSPRLRVATKAECDYYSLMSVNPDNHAIQEIQYSPENQKLDEQHYLIINKKKVKTGIWKSWYQKSGQLKSLIRYQNNKKNGLLKTYWPNGVVKRVDTFADDSLLNGVCYNQKGKIVPHFNYETSPHFPGGTEAMYRYFSRRIYYPQRRLVNGEGKVIVRFLVTAEGKIQDVTVLNIVDQNMANQVIKAIEKMPKWVPGKIDGEPTAQYVRFPITFSTRYLR